MRVIAIKERSGRDEIAGGTWYDTKIFEDDEPIYVILGWAGRYAIGASDPQKAGKYGRLFLSVPDNEILP